MNKLSKCITTFLLVALVNSCSTKTKVRNKTNDFEPTNLLDSNYHKKRFDSLISCIAKEYSTGIDYSGELIGSPEFSCIFQHSDAYLEDAIALLSKKDSFSDLQPAICIYSMQNLNATDYSNFCGVYLTLFERKKIPQEMLETAILPNFLEIRIIPENYKNFSVVKLLKAIIAEKRISKEFKNQLESVLSGVYIKRLKDN